MSRAILMVVIAAALAACHDEEGERRRLQASLPAGCTFQDLGSFGAARQVLVVTCDGRATRSTTSTTSSGKSSSDNHQIQVDKP
jgi:hypothetical protein